MLRKTIDAAPVRRVAPYRWSLIVESYYLLGLLVFRRDVLVRTE